VSSIRESRGQLSTLPRGARHLWVAVGVFAIAGAPAAGCANAAALPGTAWGTFSVVGTLGTNTCGTGVGPANPWDFDADVSLDGTTVYLEQSGTSSELTGTLSGTATTLTMASTSNVDATDAGDGACNLTQSASLALTFDSATAPTSFTGTAVYTFAAATDVSADTNCTDQLTSSGGVYDTLPCTINYTLTATKQ
jgi:hypothetical protein